MKFPKYSSRWEQIQLHCPEEGFVCLLYIYIKDQVDSTSTQAIKLIQISVMNHILINSNCFLLRFSTIFHCHFLGNSSYILSAMQPKSNSAIRSKITSECWLTERQPDANTSQK